MARGKDHGPQPPFTYITIQYYIHMGIHRVLPQWAESQKPWHWTEHILGHTRIPETMVVDSSLACIHDDVPVNATGGPLTTCRA